MVYFMKWLLLIEYYFKFDELVEELFILKFIF